MADTGAGTSYLDRVTDFFAEPSGEFDPGDDAAHRYADPDEMYVDRDHDGRIDMVIEDVDRDGDIDRITTYPLEEGHPVVVTEASGAFGDPEPNLGYAVDTDGDGDMDRVVLDSTTHTHTVYEDVDNNQTADVTYTVDDRYSGSGTVEPDNPRRGLL
ncbi:hypothetical protein GCM10009557_22650 [Virgisporangium ochraceum]|uniref:Uncharacterized protein n=1 Tax=Virgisporangium ochraceum TaxID=65505 RepID=A0A8J3ZQZ7_9ACTN|nr:hypothetical protein Voc01_032260 [Virgisporangium ochraceum]